MKFRMWMWIAAVSLFAALVIPAQARIVYTPVNVNLPTNGSYPIDLNGDGITDFTFQISHTFHVCNINWFAYRNTLNVQPTSAGVFAGGIVGGNWASALQSGVQIDSHQSFYGGDDLMYDVQQSIGGPCRPTHMYGYWIFVQQRYLGLEFQINGAIHYGWAELSTDGRYGNAVNFLYGFAYETIPGKAILTGQTMDSPDEPGIGPDSVEPGDSGPTASVAPQLSAAPQLQSTGDTRAAIPVGMAAQDGPWQDHKSKHHTYKLIDLGTFGGPDSAVGGFGTFFNDAGTFVGGADTSIPDPYAPNCFDPECFVQHASQWKNGALTDLGALPGVNSSYASGVSANGLIVGLSQNGVIDPLLGVPEIQAVRWNNGKIINLGNLGGNESFANNVNSRGQIVGPAANAIPDPYSMFGWGTQTRAFLWENGVMHDLGTLGGPDAAAFLVNRRGQVAGQAYTNSTPNPVTGIPTQDPFLWQNGRMFDLGTLGGTLSFTNYLNDRGQVVGQSNLSGDLVFHPFLWDRGVLTDLGTFGGDTGFATVVNEKGDVIGRADVPGSKTHHGFIWRDGVLTDLGVFRSDACSTGWFINQEGQIVGTAGVMAGGCNLPGHGFLWENGGPLVDLNSLVPPGSGLEMTEAVAINDRGEISGIGVVANGDVHAYVLIPDGDCDDECEGRIVASQNNAALTQNTGATKQISEAPASPLERFRTQMRQRYHLPGQPAAPRD